MKGSFDGFKVAIPARIYPHGEVIAVICKGFKLIFTVNRWAVAGH